MRLADWADCGRAHGWIVRRDMFRVEMRRGVDTVVVTRRTIKVNDRAVAAGDARQIVEQVNASDV